MKRIVIEQISEKQYNFLKAFLENYEIGYEEKDVNNTVEEFIDSLELPIRYSRSTLYSEDKDYEVRSFKNGKDFLSSKREDIADILNYEMSLEVYDKGMVIRSDTLKDGYVLMMESAKYLYVSKIVCNK